MINEKSNPGEFVAFKRVDTHPEREVRINTAYVQFYEPQALPREVTNLVGKQVTVEATCMLTMVGEQVVVEASMAQLDEVFSKKPLLEQSPDVAVTKILAMALASVQEHRHFDTIRYVEDDTYSIETEADAWLLSADEYRLFLRELLKTV